ncbi:Thrombospondin type 3 repeat:OmpA/MotB [Indibacter alkaliphilus LW1]|uniref:Thrombospondin type 3 repeat:OmpA/MotB n=1 Tax=Indibacter alkaliphilus (strain CCUG 57479 / KCTC 22604 / LW1) TaxID=1189612 RepID=S2DKI8_INDAL|nr:OmpA family protein [Indibacter alkaliphilus]EOZ97745.1 Thrombospondin type 3 repeat:OmpA/MotB [Indibacter alkaliphilus LW1]
MKKSLLALMLMLLVCLVVQAQDEYNKWSIEINGGFNKPMAPLSPGYLSPTLNLGHVGLGARYMFNEKFGLMGDAGFGRFREARGNSPEFVTDYARFNAQGVVNFGRLFNFESFTQSLGLLFHAGPGIGWFTNDDRPTLDFDRDYLYHISSGFTGQVKLSDRFALLGDISVHFNGRQRYTFDGRSFIIPPLAELDDVRLAHTTGTWWTGTLGLAYYIGKADTHADWYIPGEKYATKEELATQMGEIRNMLKDSDGDGVPDYLDQEPNTPAGARVDALGRTLDSDGDGIPDHLDKCPFAPGPASNDGCPLEEVEEIDYFRKAINEGYLNVYFAFDSSKPLNYSSSAANFVANFLKRNPGVNIHVKGYADEIGPEDYNMKLSERRAKAVVDLLVAAGITQNRISHQGYGEDTSVDKSSAEARQLARRVSFEVD